MGIRDADHRGLGRPDPARSWPSLRFSIRDSRLAIGLAEGLGRDGWRVAWARLGDGSWEARVAGPSLPIGVASRGRSRVSAISGAHLEAIRRAGLAPDVSHDA